jgi:hypothetical protein
MSKICSNFAVENEFMTCQNRVTNSHKILILNKIIADLQQVTKINSTVGLSGFESWLSNKRKSPVGDFLVVHTDSHPGSYLATLERLFLISAKAAND